MRRISEGEALTALFDGKADVLIWSIGSALSADGAPIESVQRALLRDILRLGWPGAKDDYGHYHPLLSGPADADGRIARSFLPEDMQPDDERTLLALCNASKHNECRARIYDVLYEKFHNPSHATEAIKNLLSCISEHTGDEWQNLQQWCARATSLSSRLSKDQISQDVLDAVMRSAEIVRKGTFKFAYAQFVSILCTKCARHLRTRGMLTDEKLRECAKHLEVLSKEYKQAGLWPYIENLRGVQISLYKCLKDRDSTISTYRALAEDHISESEARPEARAMCLQDAANIAMNQGFKDILLRVKAMLPAAIADETARMKEQSISFYIDRSLFEHLDEIIVRSSKPAWALRALASIPAFCTLFIERIREEAEAELSQTPFFWNVKSTTLRSGNIAFVVPGNSEQKKKHYLGQKLQLHYAKIFTLSHYFLEKLFDSEVSEIDLYEALVLPTWVQPSRLHQFQMASQSFAQRNWQISGILLSLSFEGFLRDWLRSRGYPALRYDADGTTGDELLNSLVWNPEVIRLLGEDYLAMIRYLLCDPELGYNLRNEVAHSNLKPHTFNPASVLLVALCIVRLSILQPGSEEEREDASLVGSIADSDDTDPDDAIAEEVRDEPEGEHAQNGPANVDP